MYRDSKSEIGNYVPFIVTLSVTYLSHGSLHSLRMFVGATVFSTVIKVELFRVVLRHARKRGKREVERFVIVDYFYQE